MERDEYDDVHIAVIVVGDAGVGKTNVIHLYSKGKVANNTMPTVGVEYTSKIVPVHTSNGQQKRAKVQIWDTAGQQNYRSITMGHYKKAVGALVMFDVTNPNSYSSIQYWVNIVKERADQKVKIGIIGNKTDLTSKRFISSSEAENKAKQLAQFYAQTSVKDPVSIEQAFKHLVKEVYQAQKNRDDYGHGPSQKLAANNNSNPSCKCCN